jgi:hypothetical protein
MNKIRDFFWQCSGANKSLLEECPTEASKYAGIGATVFFTGVFASLAGFYATYTVFENIWPAIGIGLIWGLMIFNLDRYIVSSMRKSGDRWKELKMATPRIILAIMIAVVISKPLEMRIFEKEIDSELILMEQEYQIERENLIKSRYSPSIDSLRNEIAVLKEEIIQKTEDRDELRRIAQQEADGTGGTMRRNAGPIYRIKKADADKVDEELTFITQANNLLIEEKTAKINEFEGLMEKDIQEKRNSAIDGLASRMEALNRLTKSSKAVWIANWFIILLFIAIETAPVLVKLISSTGPYDYKLQSIEYDFKANGIESLAKSNAKVKKRTEKAPSVEREFVTERLDLEINRV